MKKLYTILLLLLFTNPVNAELKQHAILMLLDKVTANSQTIKISVGTTYAFESLDIKVLRCDKNPPEDTPESSAYLLISEPEKSSATIFRGWMFASNPSINSLEHPVYDVWVKDCK